MALEDQEKALEQSMARMQAQFDAIANGMGMLGQGFAKQAKAMGVTDAEAKKVADSFSGLKNAATGLTEAEKARLDSQKKLAESEMYLKDATGKATQALGSFVGALLDNNATLTKFNGAIGSAGDAALSVGKALGGWALIIGGLTKGLTVLLEAQLKITQSYETGKNQLNKMGGAGAHTAESLQKMAREADLNSETLDRMIKPMKGLGSDIMILGNNAGAAQKEFAELIKVTDEERKMMMRLGINQEEMMQGTADYLALQAASGRSVKNELQDREKLRRASIDYQTSLLDLAALTGKDVATLKEKQKEAALDAQRQIKDMADQAKIDDLMAQGRKDEALAIQKEMERRNAALDALVDAPEALRKGAKEMLITGTISGEESRKLARNNMQGPMAELAKTIKEGGDPVRGAAKIQDQYNSNQRERLKSSERALLVSEQARKDFDFANVEDNRKRAARMGTSMEQEYLRQKEARDKISKPGQSAAADAVATVQEATITATGAVEDLAMKFPILGTAAAAAAAALGLLVIAAKGMSGGGFMDKIKGLLPIGGGAGGGMPGTGGIVPGGAAPGGLPNVSPAAAGSATNAGKAAGALGAGGGNILTGAANGLKAFANPMVIAGAAGFGAAIAAVGAGLAGATWIMGKALPSLAEGLQPFEKLDGKKLIDSGKGIAAIGGGLAVFGAGGVAAGIGGIIGGLSDKLGSFLGVDGPMKKLEEFDKLKIDGDRVKKNAEAFMAFNKAFTVGGGASAAGGMGNLIGGFTDKISGRLGLDGPFKKLQEFGELKINSANVKTNAEAMASFGDAMSKYKGTDQGMWGALSEGVSSFFQIEPPYAKMEKFAKIDLGEGGAKRVKTNAQAFVYFSQALAEYKGGGELKNAADNIVGGIVKMFGGDDVMGKFVKFTKLDVDPDKALKLGQAFAAYTSAIGMARGGGGAGGGAAAGGGGASGGGGIFSKIGAALGFGGGSGGGDKGTGGGKEASGGTTEPTRVASGKGGTMSEDDIKNMIIKHEGIRYEPYKDSLGLWTVGVGHLIGDGKSLPQNYNRKFSHEEVMAMFEKDYEKHKKQAQSNVPGFSKYDSMGQGALIDLTFNMGPGWPKKFPNTSKKLAAGDTYGAARGLEDSLWYQQVKSRAPTIVGMIENSKVSAKDGGLAMGPETGYPATLHGNEMIVPLDPNSFLAELGKKTNTEIQAQMQEKASAVESSSPDVFKELIAVNQSMMDMMSNKLDSVINRLESSNSTQDKILKYSQA